MAIQGVGITVTFLVWDTANNVPSGDDAANLTMRVITDGTAAAATNPPVFVENGEHKIDVEASEMDGHFITVEGSSVTADTVVIPLHIITEQGFLDMLIDRLGGFSGAGTSNIFNWLRAIFRKDVSAADDMDGDYDPAADSLEAIRDRGDDAWVKISGAGAITSVYTLYVTGTTDPIIGADVWITSDSGGATMVAGPLQTNGSGQVTFYLDAGTYYVWRQKAGYNFDNPETWEVS